MRGQKGGVKALFGETLVLECHVCGKTFEHDVSNFSPRFLEEFGEYECLRARPCPHCSAHGKTVTMFVNMNIPEGEYDELQEEDEGMPLHEKNARKFVRELMWKKRPDLRGLDRKKFNEERKHLLDEFLAKKRARAEERRRVNKDKRPENYKE